MLFFPRRAGFTKYIHKHIIDLILLLLFQRSTRSYLFFVCRTQLQFQGYRNPFHNLSFFDQIFILTSIEQKQARQKSNYI